MLGTSSAQGALVLGKIFGGGSQIVGESREERGCKLRLPRARLGGKENGLSC
jgi:hypothetical protein